MSPQCALGGSCCRDVVQGSGCFPGGVCLPSSVHVGSPSDALLEPICFSLCKEMPRKSLGCRERPWTLTLLAWKQG